LRVPDTLLGKNVKCPKCQTTFLAAADTPEEPEEAIVNEPAPRRRAAPPPEEPEDEGPPPEEYEEEEGRPRRRRRGRRTAAAESAIAGPAISLMVLAGLDYVLLVVGLIMRLAGVGIFAAQNVGGPGGGAGGAEAAANMAGGIVGNIVGFCIATVILLGALKMKKLEGYGYAWTASILAILPCGNCCCVGLPLGIWAIVILLRPEVKESFS
jgi:hypothetical protein